MKNRIGLLALIGWLGLLLIHPSETGIKSPENKDNDPTNESHRKIIQNINYSVNKTEANNIMLPIKRELASGDEPKKELLDENNLSQKDIDIRDWSQWKSIKRKIIKSDEESRLEAKLKINEGLLKTTKELLLTGGLESDLNEAVDYLVEALSHDPQKAQIELSPIYSSEKYKNEKIFEYQAELAFWLIQQNPEHEKWIQLTWKDNRSDEVLKRITSYRGRTL